MDLMDLTEILKDKCLFLQWRCRRLICSNAGVVLVCSSDCHIQGFSKQTVVLRTAGED